MRNWRYKSAKSMGKTTPSRSPPASFDLLRHLLASVGTCSKPDLTHTGPHTLKEQRVYSHIDNGSLKRKPFDVDIFQLGIQLFNTAKMVYSNVPPYCFGGFAGVWDRGTG